MPHPNVQCTMYNVHCTYSNKILVFQGKMAWHITLKRRKSVKLGHFCCKLYSGKNSNGLLFQDISNRFFIWNKLGKPQIFFFFLVDSPLRPLGPPRLSGQFFFFFVFFLKKSEPDFDNFFLQYFWTKRAVFLGKYFNKSVKDCEFSVRQLNTIH